jgi:asparagine synthase (glutamine-hydrolysing)
MCGTARNRRRKPASNLVRPIVHRMTDSLTHQGPDDEGLFVADTVGLGSRRLSIIDLAGGRHL